MRRRIQWTTLCAVAVVFLVRGAAAVSFTVDGTRILKDGREFVIHGINVNGPGTPWDRKTVQDVDTIAKVWKFNLVRVNCSLVPRKDGKEPNKLDEIAQTFTSRGIVVLIDLRDHVGEYYQDPPKPADTPSLADLVAWERELATRYKDNPYVWFEVMASPGTRDAKPDLAQWLHTHSQVIRAIRQVAGNIIVCEGCGRGSEDGNNGTLPAPEELSAILTHGPALVRQYSNLLFGMNVYDGWTAGGVDKLADYVDRVRSKGLALFVAEYGLGYGNDATWAIDAMFEVCRARHIGRCAWNWFPRDRGELCATDDHTGGWEIDNADGSRPGNLTWLGDAVWTDNHSAPLHGPSLDRTGWVATASIMPKGTDTGANQPDDAIGAFVADGDYWRTGAPQVPGQWFMVDMAAKRTFTRLMLDCRAQSADYPRGYEIYVSNDGVRWGAPIAAGKNGQSVLRVAFPVQNARYIKIVQTGKTWRHWQVAQLEVYAPIARVPSQRAVKEVVLETYGWRAGGEPRSWRDLQVPLHRQDGDLEHAFLDERTKPGDYYQVDMEKLASIHKIVMDCGRYLDGYPRGYALYLSANGSDWGKPVASGHGAPVTTLTFPAHTVRFIRIVQTRSGRNYWAISTFRVYGVPADK